MNQIVFFVTNDDWRIVGYIFSVLVECSLIGDKLMVSGVVIDQNRMEGTQLACLRLDS